MTRDRRLVETRTARSRGLVSGRVSGARIDTQRAAPPAELTDVVECLWSGHWDLPADAPHETRLLSDPCVHLVAEQGTQVDGGREARVVGVWTRLWRRSLTGTGQVRGVKLRAGAARAFIDLPLHTLSNRITPLDAAFPAHAAQFERSALDAGCDADAFRGLASWLTARRRTADPLVQEAVALLDAIRTRPDIQGVEALASHAGIGVRSLQKLFRGYVGGTPKWAIRRNRLQEAAARLEAGDSAGLSDLAAALGYTDQAHFARDFRAATGTPPGRFSVRVHHE